MVELWALRDGLRLAGHLGIQQLEVELDAMVIVGLLNLKKNPNLAYAPLLFDCRYLLDKLPQEDYAVFDFPFTAELETFLAKDINGLYYCRLVAVSMASVVV
nr:hypothetical protein CFP56_63199 [Quercus suber]